MLTEIPEIDLETARAALRQWHDQDGAGTLFGDAHRHGQSQIGRVCRYLRRKRSGAEQDWRSGANGDPVCFVTVVPPLWTHGNSTRKRPKSSRPPYDWSRTALRCEADSGRHRLTAITRGRQLDALSQQASGRTAKRRFRAGRSNEQKERRA